MDDDFALIDFAIVAAPPDAVAQALGTVLVRADTSPEASAAAQPGLMSRLLHRSSDAAPLLIQPRSTLDARPLVRLVLDDFGAAAAERVVRVSAPIGSNNLTLVEFREVDTPESATAAGLSSLLKNAEVFYFRLSGARHPGAHYAFHVYQNGLARRRAVSQSPRGTAPEAPWQGTDAGIFHPLETDTLTPPESPRWAIMSPERQASILEALGIEPLQLFVGIPDRPAVLVLSPAPGGLPLNEAARHLGPTVQGPATFSRTHAAAAEPMPTPAPASPIQPVQPDPVPLDPAAWEAEVTGLLLQTVEAALPEDERVPWLEALTRHLEAGQITIALREARALVARARLPEDERSRLADRLANLFAPPPPNA